LSFDAYIGSMGETVDSEGRTEQLMLDGVEAAGLGGGEVTPDRGGELQDREYNCSEQEQEDELVNTAEGVAEAKEDVAARGHLPDKVADVGSPVKASVENHAEVPS
jgi:hypothetical protein